MKKPQKNTKKSYSDAMEEAAKKYGVSVSDMAKRRGIKVIGILGGVRRQDQEPGKGSSSADPTGGRPSR